MPAKAGIHLSVARPIDQWIPAFAGTTVEDDKFFLLGAAADFDRIAAFVRRRNRMPEPAATLDEIRALMAHLPGPDLEAGTAAAERERQLTKPAAALGR